jgi:hypothetical protein
MHARRFRAGWRCLIGYPAPIGDSDISEEHGESADIDQKDFHRSPLAGHPTAIW